MNTISAKLAFLIVCISGLQTLSYGQQLQQSVSVPPCNVTVGLTASGSTASFDNRMLGCSVWALNYTSQGFTGVTVTVESASDNGGVPGVWTAFSGTVNVGSNPQTAITQGLVQLSGFNPWIRVTLSGTTGVGTVRGTLYGYKLSADASVALANAATVDIASAAITTTATSTGIATTNIQSAAFAVSVTATSGTPTLDITIQCSFNTTTWQDIYQFERITATTTLISPTIDLPCQQIRYVRTVGGGTPSITMSLTRQSKQTNGYRHVSYFDRTIAPATLNSATPAFWVEGTKVITAIVSSAAATTPCQGPAQRRSDRGRAW